MSATVIQMPGARNGDASRIAQPRIRLGDGMMPVSAADARYAADRNRIATWRARAFERQQWRRDTAKAHEYWDGNQFDSMTAYLYESRGIPMIAHNCIKRWVNSVVGTLERNLTDGVVRLEDNAMEALELALSQELKEAERMTHADRACLDAADSMVKGGIGWVEVGTVDDPFQYPDAVSSIPWREMYWDRVNGDTRADLNGSIWFERRRYFEREDLLVRFTDPEQRRIIETCGTSGDQVAWFEPELMLRNEQAWRDPNRWTQFAPTDSSVTLSEYRYRVWVEGYVVDTPGGPQIFDPEDADHMAAFQMGLVEPRAATYRRIRQSYWLGPHCLYDAWCKVPNQEVGWIPFICYQEDKTGAPYGLVRDMISLQDEINATKAKAHWSLDSSTLVADSDRVLDWDDAREALNRRDGAIALNPAVRNGHFQIDRHEGLTAQQLEMHRDAVATIGYVHGLEGPIAAGRDPGQSGVSQQVQIEQSMTCIGKPMAHYSEARRKTLDLLLAQRIARMGVNPQQMRYRDKQGAQRSVAVNVPTPDGGFLSLTELKRKVVLDDVPSTPTFRQQQFREIVDTLRAMPPQAQMMLLPAMFEMSTLPNREVYADMARQMLGQAQPKTPEEAAAMQREQALQQRAQDAEVELAEAKARSEAAKSEHTLNTINEVLARVEKLVAETAAIRQDMDAQAIALAQGGPDKTEALLRW